MGTRSVGHTQRLPRGAAGVGQLLLLLPSVPWPSDAGARIRNAGLLRLLSTEHEVDVIAFGVPGTEGELGRVARQVTLVPTPRRRSTARRVIDMATSDLPDMARRLWSPAFAEELRCRLQERAYDAVQAEGIEMARYLRVVPPKHRIYDAHNAEFLLQARLASLSSATAGLYSRLQWRRLERFERDLVRQSRLTLTVSQHDANQLFALGGPGTNVRVVPNGVDVAAYPLRAASTHVSRDLLFLGKLDFRPNVEALAWFIPRVLGSVGGARLFAVGAAPPRWLVEAGQHDQRIAVTGYVPDERPYFARCAALVLPLQTGGGSRLKALVAMASGVPIVSTRLGMEGLDAEPETHYLLADCAAEWVAALQRVLEWPALRQHLARNARALVEQRYDWAAIRPDVEAAYTWLN